jgi:hypothetical protein
MFARLRGMRRSWSRTTPCSAVHRSSFRASFISPSAPRAHACSCWGPELTARTTPLSGPSRSRTRASRLPRSRSYSRRALAPATDSRAVPGAADALARSQVRHRACRRAESQMAVSPAARSRPQTAHASARRSFSWRAVDDTKNQVGVLGAEPNPVRAYIVWLSRRDWAAVRVVLSVEPGLALRQAAARGGQGPGRSGARRAAARRSYARVTRSG